MINIYCDESCHLPKDKSDIMVLGAVACEGKHVKKICKDLRQLKTNHGLSRDFELKWSKVGEGKIDYYCNVIDYFFFT